MNRIVIALILVIMFSPAWADSRECGLKQSSIDKRIQDCSLFPRSSKMTSANVQWDLVARSFDLSSGRTYEVWRDSETGLLWGDRLEGSYAYDNIYSPGAYAVEIDTDSSQGRVIKEIACLSDRGSLANARITEKRFGLPTIEELDVALNNGILEVVPNLYMSLFVYWSATLDSYLYQYARVVDTRGMSTTSMYRGLSNSVRCVGR